MASGLLLATDPPLPTTPERSLWGWLVAHRWRYRAVIAGMLLAYCLLGLGGSIISIDEGFYTQAAREMLARQSFWTLYLNGEPRYYKPPLAMWSIMASYALLGESDWAARLPSALLAGVVALLVLGLAWELFHDPQTNLLALLLFLLLPVTVVLSHMVMTDMYLLAGLAAGMYAWFRARRDWRWYGVFALGLGWGLLSKSVAALALPGWALVIGVVRREWRQLGGVVLASGVAMILALPWVMINLASSRPGFLHEALLQEIVQRILGEYGPWPPATWLGHLLYYPRVMFTDFLPWTVLLLVPMGRVFKDLFRREALGEQALGW
ncbi:MAG: glycosyltransferase family 39 protein, partial [Deinococcus sp.]|nr:glycosyltransferase family 39 protein [Deinococcus sp.]